jgi:hypothetical protein
MPGRVCARRRQKEFEHEGNITAASLPQPAMPIEAADAY